MESLLFNEQCDIFSLVDTHIFVGSFCSLYGLLDYEDIKVFFFLFFWVIIRGFVVFYKEVVFV